MNCGFVDTDVACNRSFLLFSLLLVKATRASDDATVILVEWTIIDDAVTTVSLKIQEGGGSWKAVDGADKLGRSTTEFKVTGLKADKTYKFRVYMGRQGEQDPPFVESNQGMCNSNNLVVSEPQEEMILLRLNARKTQASKHPIPVPPVSGTKHNCP